MKWRLAISATHETHHHILFWTQLIFENVCKTILSCPLNYRHTNIATKKILASREKNPGNYFFYMHQETVRNSCNPNVQSGATLWSLLLFLTDQRYHSPIQMSLILTKARLVNSQCKVHLDNVTWSSLSVNWLLFTFGLKNLKKLTHCLNKWWRIISFGTSETVCLCSLSWLRFLFRHICTQLKIKWRISLYF